MKVNEIPVIVYKYRDWRNPNHKKILTHNELFAASTLSFNDPFDCAIPLRYDLLSKRELVDKAKKNINRRYPSLTRKERRQKAKDLAKVTIAKGINHLKTTNEYMLQENNDWFGVISLTGKCDNILMWSHYANCHTGFCVGFHSQLLFNNTPALTMGLVNYNGDDQNNFPIIKPNKDYKDLHISQFFNKANDWKYENEVRMVFADSVNKVVKFYPRIIAKVILGCKIDKNDKEEILEIIQKNYHGLPVYQAEKHPEKFELIFRQIL